MHGEYESFGNYLKIRRYSFAAIEDSIIKITLLYLKLERFFLSIKYIIKCIP